MRSWQNIWFDQRVTFEAQVQTWVDRRALVELTESGFAQVDIDELLDPPPVRAAAAMLECSDIAMAHVRASGVGVTGIVVIPLSPAEDQVEAPLAHPSLADVFAHEWQYGPGLEVPGLYLVRHGAEQSDLEVEEYRISVTAPELGTNAAYYRAWRTFRERETHPGDWSRAFYIRTG